MAQDLPRKDLNILLDVPRLWRRKAHDGLEEVLAVGFGLGDGERSEALEVPANAILLLDGEADSDEGLEKVDGVHTGDEALLLAVPVNAADADTVRHPVLRGDGSEVSVDGTAMLHSGELH